MCRVAVALAAATLFVCVRQTPRAEAAVHVLGLDAEWLRVAAERSLNAVCDHISESETDEAKKTLLALVAGRLMAGYAVEDTRGEAGEFFLTLRREAEPPEWNAVVSVPNLSSPVDEWFASDVEGLPDELALLMKGVPIEALSWGDSELKAVVDERCAKRLPGWRASLIVRSSDDGSALEVSFTPEQPLALAVTPRITSTTIPALLHSSLKADLTKGLAPIIGIPVAWLETHTKDLSAMSRGILESESLVEQAVAVPEVSVTPGGVSDIDVELESRRYATWVWMSVYAGAEGKYPEVGLHFGRRTQPLPKWDLEVYLELIASLDDFDTEMRLGTRWSPWRNFWLGAEWSHSDELWWAHTRYLEGRIKRPYAWLRLSEEGDTDCALGFRITEFFSVEIHYDSRDDDPVNIRMIVNL